MPQKITASKRHVGRALLPVFVYCSHAGALPPPFVGQASSLSYENAGRVPSPEALSRRARVPVLHDQRGPNSWIVL
jgi:hypothetical protein